MKPEGSLTCSHEPTTVLRSQPDNYKQSHSLYFFKIRFNITLSTFRFTDSRFASDVPTRTVKQYAFHISITHATYHVYFTLFGHVH